MLNTDARARASLVMKRSRRGTRCIYHRGSGCRARSRIDRSIRWNSTIGGNNARRGVSRRVSRSFSRKDEGKSVQRNNKREERNGREKVRAFARGRASWSIIERACRSNSNGWYTPINIFMRNVARTHTHTRSLHGYASVRPSVRSSISYFFPSVRCHAFFFLFLFLFNGNRFLSWRNWVSNRIRESDFYSPLTVKVTVMLFSACSAVTDRRKFEEQMKDEIRSNYIWNLEDKHEIVSCFFFSKILLGIIQIICDTVKSTL